MPSPGHNYSSSTLVQRERADTSLRQLTDSEEKYRDKLFNLLLFQLTLKSNSRLNV